MHLTPYAPPLYLRCQLYLQEDPYNFLRSEPGLQARLAKGLADGAIASRYTHRLYKEMVGPYLRSVSPLLFCCAVTDQQAIAGTAVTFFCP